MSYVLTSSSGLVFAFWFFLGMSATIAFVIYGLLSWPSVRRRELGLGVVRKAVAIPVALLVWFVIFTAIYLSSLAGFHTVTLDDDSARLDYAIPPSSVRMRYADIGDIIRTPAYKSLWRLQIYTLTGDRFQSAPGSYREIKTAAEDLERRRKRARNALVL
jgi:hypothetical protein